MANPLEEIQKSLTQAQEEIARSLNELNGNCVPEADSRTRINNRRLYSRRKRFTKSARRSHTVEITPTDPAKVSANLMYHQRNVGLLNPGREEARLKARWDQEALELNHAWYRSTSVRDLGQESAVRFRNNNARSTCDMLFRHSEASRLDFGNPEAVSNWASQILAEIRSIPGSQDNLMIEENEEVVPALAANPEEVTKHLEEACVQLRDIGILSTSCILFSDPKDGTLQRKEKDLSSSSDDENGSNRLRVPPPPLRRKRSKKKKRTPTPSGDESTLSTPTTLSPLLPHSPPPDDPNTHTHDASTEVSSSLGRDAHRIYALPNKVRSSDVGESPNGAVVPIPAERQSLRRKAVGEQQLDAWTQTTPLSLSPSSSFSWMSGGELEGYEAEEPPLSPTARFLQSLPLGVRPPSDSDSDDPNYSTLGRREDFSEAQDDSLMLSDGSGGHWSGEEPPQPPPRRINQDSSPASIPSPVQLDAAFDESLKLLLHYTYNEQSGKDTPSSARKEKATMGESIYDNVPNLTRNRLPFRNGPTVDEWHSTERKIPRDLSIQSGILADSESSPLSPEPDKSSSSSEGSFSLQQRSEPWSEEKRPPPPPSPRLFRPSVPASSLPLLDRLGSLDDISTSPYSHTLLSQGSDSGFSSIKERTEAEAQECCRWLRAAGFPQYAQMYEEGKFPLELNGAHDDHEFLDPDSIRALFRRLETLNRCALKKSTPITLRRNQLDEESEEEEEDVALSNKWRYQRKSKTWSRIESDFLSAVADNSMKGNSGQMTGESLDSLEAFEQDSVHVMVAESVVHKHHLSPRLIRSSERQQSAGGPDAALPPSRLQRSQSERIKDQTKAFMRRMGLGKSPGSRRRKPLEATRELVIGQPVLVSHHSASPPTMRMLRAPLDSDGAHSPNLVINRVEQTNTNSQDPRRHALFLGTERGSPDFIDNNSNKIQKAHYSSELVLPSSAAVSQSWVRNPPPPQSERRPRRKLENFRAGAISEIGLAQAGKQGLVFYNPSFGQQQKDANGFLAESSPEMESRSNTRLIQQSHSSMDSSDTDSPRYWDQPERRDSGVGSSLSRSPSGPMKSRKQAELEAEGPIVSLQMDALSLPHLTTLRKLALLSLTGLMEKYSPNKSSGGWSWGVQKLFKRIKSPEHREGQLFGLPLSAVAQQSTLPLPQSILHTMRFLRKQAPEAVGIFRKSGVRSRIQKLKLICEQCTELPVFDPQQTYDLADMLKQYFRELPEPLMTGKLSETFIAIHLYVPPHLHLEAMQKAVILLPDENREVLHSLLAFLNDISTYADSNQMTAQNLAVCLAPSLFQLSPRVAALSPTRRHKTITAGLPNERELRENTAAQTCLTQMILHYKRLFLVPAGMRGGIYSSLGEQSPATLQQLGQPRGNYQTYLEACVSAIMKEQKERWKGWMTEGSVEGVEMSCKKLADGNPLRLWRCWTEVEAPPREVLNRVLRDRDLWDEDVLKWKVLHKLSDNTDIFQFVQNDMPPHPTRDYCLLRHWRNSLAELRGGCVLVETSISCRDAPLLGGVRAFCLASRYLIEPSGAGRSRITYVSRIDTKGRGKSWYNKVFGYICARQIAHLRDSFRQADGGGPETKV